MGLHKRIWKLETRIRRADAHGRWRSDEQRSRALAKLERLRSPAERRARFRRADEAAPDVPQ